MDPKVTRIHVGSRTPRLSPPLWESTRREHSLREELVEVEPGNGPRTHVTEGKQEEKNKTTCEGVHQYATLVTVDEDSACQILVRYFLKFESRFESR